MGYAAMTMQPRQPRHSTAQHSAQRADMAPFPTCADEVDAHATGACGQDEAEDLGVGVEALRGGGRLVGHMLAVAEWVGGSESQEVYTWARRERSGEPKAVVCARQPPWLTGCT